MEKKVIDFPRKPVRKIPATKPANDSAHNGDKVSVASRILSVLAWAGRAVLFLVYIVMFWLRGPIVGACSIASVIFLGLWLFSLYAFPDKKDMVWAFGGTSFLSFVVAWAYDYVLIKLSPVPMVNTL
jgi:hypothetical protein